MEQIISRICYKFRVEVKPRNLPDFGKRYTFSCGTPQQTSLAASMLARHFSSMNIKLNTERQKQLFHELDEIGQMQTWTEELGLVVNRNQWNTNIELRGPQIAQGQLMRRIADYSNDLNKRFREYELSSTVVAFFTRQKAASSKLQQIDSRWSSRFCLVSFLPKTSTIVIIGKPQISFVDMDDCENEIRQLLNEITATTYNEEIDDEEEDDDDSETIEVMEQNRRCVFCKQAPSISTNFFRICGHAYCRCAAQVLCTSIRFPLQCNECQTNIHIRDIQIIFSNEGQLFMHLLKTSIRNYLIENAKQDDRIFCPNTECNGLIKLDRNYQTCLTCGINVCSKCQVIDDNLHIGRTCVERAEEKKQQKFLPQLFNAAKKFVRDNWPLDVIMQPIHRTDENPYLEKEYKSLRRFYKGYETLGQSLPVDLAKGFFTYHGTASQAIQPICQDGFDPKLRDKQVYGRGEYFGVTANISHGYSQKGSGQPGINQIIIAFLLRCAQITTKENFCHVVDNPIDWKYAFSLPVLIVTYGPSVSYPLSPFPFVIPDYVDDDECHMNVQFRWYWSQDNGQFEPYNDKINEILEKHYQQWKLHVGPSTIITPSVTRYIDDIPQTYLIDYENNRQTNTKTSFQRTIARRPMNKSPDSPSIVRTVEPNQEPVTDDEKMSPFTRFVNSLSSLFSKK